MGGLPRTVCVRTVKLAKLLRWPLSALPGLHTLGVALH